MRSSKKSLANTEEITKAPGIGFVEWALLDMSLSLGVMGGNLAPYPPLMEESRQRVIAATKADGVAYAGQVNRDTVIDFIDEGIMVGIATSPDIAETSRIAHETDDALVTPSQNGALNVSSARRRTQQLLTGKGLS